MRNFLSIILILNFIWIYSQNIEQTAMQFNRTNNLKEEIDNNFNHRVKSYKDSLKKFQFSINAGGGGIFFVDKMPLFKNQGSYIYCIGLNALSQFKKHKNLAYFLQFDFGNRIYSINIPNLDFVNLTDPFSNIGEDGIEKFARKKIQLNYFSSSFSLGLLKKMNKFNIGIGLQINHFFMPKKYSINENFEYTYPYRYIGNGWEYKTITNKIEYSRQYLTTNSIFYIEYKLNTKNAIQLRITLPIIPRISISSQDWRKSKAYNADYQGTQINLSNIIWSSSLIGIFYNFYF